MYRYEDRARNADKHEFSNFGGELEIFYASYVIYFPSPNLNSEFRLGELLGQNCVKVAAIHGVTFNIFFE